MAKLLSDNEFAETMSLAAHIAALLPDEYTVVERPVVHDQELEAVVVGPQGLFVLHGRDWKGTVTPVPGLGWRQELPDGQVAHVPNPAGDARKASSAVEAFLKDEFRSLRPQVRQFLVLTDPEANIATATVTDPIAVGLGDVDALIVSRVSPPKRSLPDEKTRRALARALYRGHLTVGQRTAEPFIFRSGGTFGSGAKVWTLRDAAKHMDRHPEDAVFHLHNGTFAQWLDDQGSPELASLARRVTDEYARDPQAALEAFLSQAGLVKRRRPRVRPRRVNLGYALAGESCSARMSVRKGRGRGYLSAVLEPDDPWLRVDPNQVNGEPLNAKVTAETAGLPISAKPLRSAIRIESDMWAEPLRIPVRLRIRGVPSRLATYVLRPLIGMLVALVLGAVCGWALGSSGITPSSGLAGPAGARVSWAAAFAVLVGAAWAVLGALRGYWQPPAWPPTVALGRWLVRLLLWAAALSVVAVAGHWAWGRLGRGLALGDGGPTMAGAVLIGCAVSVVPAAIGEMRVGRRARKEPGEPIAGLEFRPFRRAGVAAIVLVLVGIGAYIAVPLWQRFDGPQVVSSVRERVNTGIDDLQVRLDTWLDGVVLDAYDRRATPRPTEDGTTPSPTARVTTPTAGAGTATPEATATPPAEDEEGAS
jgi:hypothetical protein